MPIYNIAYRNLSVHQCITQLDGNVQLWYSNTITLPRCTSMPETTCVRVTLLTRAREAALTALRKLAVGIPAAGWSPLMNSCVLYASSGHFFLRGSGGSLHVPACAGNAGKQKHTINTNCMLRISRSLCVSRGLSPCGKMLCMLRNSMRPYRVAHTSLSTLAGREMPDIYLQHRDRSECHTDRNKFCINECVMCAEHARTLVYVCMNEVRFATHLRAQHFDRPPWTWKRNDPWYWLHR